MKPRELRLLIMHVSTRCDQTCAHCSIWKSNGGSRDSLGREERLALLREARSLGARGVLFTGGEPLLCDHIESLARAAAGLGLSVQIATNGLGLERAASWLDAVDEVYVSVEGPEAVHDSIRGASMFSRLQASLRAVRALQRRPRLIGRSVISGRNAALLDQTVAAARTLGLDGISFLGADVTSEAFGGDPSARRFLRPTAAEVAAMLRAISRLEPTGDLGGFVIEDARKLAWMAADFLADADGRRAPACNAPEWSSVVEADGALRPCFFQKAVSRVGGGVPLSAGRDAAAYRAALGDLGVGNAICGGCVCPKHVPFGVSRVAQRVRAVVGRALATPSRRSGVSA
jgi:MoaA/NifB/PqqE/SkfB family radical SAM enzyme